MSKTRTMIRIIAKMPVDLQAHCTLHSWVVGKTCAYRNDQVPVVVAPDAAVTPAVKVAGTRPSDAASTGPVTGSPSSSSPTRLGLLGRLAGLALLPALAQHQGLLLLALKDGGRRVHVPALGLRVVLAVQAKPPLELVHYILFLGAEISHAITTPGRATGRRLRLRQQLLWQMMIAAHRADVAVGGGSINDGMERVAISGKRIDQVDRISMVRARSFPVC